MTMKPVARCLFLASALLIITSTTNGQTPTSGGRRTELEYLDRGFDLPGITAQEEAPGFWDTPEGKARYEQLQMEQFEENREKLFELGKEDWARQYDSMSDRRSRRDFENQTEDLERVTDDMIKFFEWRFDAERIEVEEPSEKSVRDRVVRITPMVVQILETISTLTGGGIQIDTFVEMRENLAQIHALSRILRN